MRYRHVLGMKFIFSLFLVYGFDVYVQWWQRLM